MIFANTFVFKPIIFAPFFRRPAVFNLLCRSLIVKNLYTPYTVHYTLIRMYLKFIRNNQPYGNFRRGTLYSVHFQPNEKGGYNEHLYFISDAYEIASGYEFPLPLIYAVGVRRTNNHLRLALGLGNRCSLLHLINRDARERLYKDVLDSLRNHHDCRIEVCEQIKRRDSYRAASN